MADDPGEDENLVQEFDLLAERAGLAIPPERRAGMLAQFKDLRRMVALLHGPREASAEPASIYRIETILRSR